MSPRCWAVVIGLGREPSTSGEAAPQQKDWENSRVVIGGPSGPPGRRAGAAGGPLLVFVPYPRIYPTSLVGRWHEESQTVARDLKESRLKTHAGDSCLDCAREVKHQMRVGDFAHWKRSPMIQANEQRQCLLTINQVVERLGVCRRTIEREIQRKRFAPPVKIGSASRWPETDLSAYLELLKAERGHSAS